MADRRLLYTSLLLCLIHYGKSASISFSPPSPLLISANETQSGRPLTITCSHSGSTLLTINLFKNSTAGTRTKLMYATTIGNTNGLPQLESGVSGTVTGSVTQNQGSVSLTINQASCDAAGIYICSSGVYEGTELKTLEQSANYVVNVNPSQATLVPQGTASGASWYIVGDKVTLTCSIDVGTLEQTTEVNFVWQYEVDNGFGSKAFQNYPNPEDIETSRPPPVTQKCQTQNWISTLSRNLTIEDSDRRYKCFITKGGTRYEDQAGYAVFDVREEGYVTNAPSTASAAKADVGMIVGIIIAILVVIAVVVVIVVFVIRHRRQQEQDGAYEPEKPAEPPVMSVPPPYTSEPPRFSRNDKPRGGHTNKAMDDEHDGKEPEKEKERSKHRDRGDRDPDRERRYDARPPRQEFEAGRRNPGFERNVDDPRGRRYSSDDGGTDVNRSISLGEGDHTIGSAV